MSDLIIGARDPVARISLNRPDVHNALNEKLIAELTEALERFGSASWIKAIVVTGMGKSFCAGADLEWMGKMASYTHDENLADAGALQKLLHTLYTCPKITIASVNGAAMGGGAGLVAACDYAVASTTASFAFSEVKLGLIPAVISPYVVEKIGHGAARALCATGRRFDAVTALRIGLVQETCAPEDLYATVNSVLTDAFVGGPLAVRETKQLLRQIDGLTPTEAAAFTVPAIAGARVSDEGQEGIRAFLEKRKPSWLSTL